MDIKVKEVIKMRRVAKGSVVGPALLGLGIALMLLGFFGGAIGLRGLSVLEGPEHPDLVETYYTNLMPGATQRIMVTLLWYGHLEDGSYYHGIAGVPLECFVNGESKGVKYTDGYGYAEWSFAAPQQPGSYEVKVKFAGNDQYPPVEDSGWFVVKEPQDPKSQSQIDSSTNPAVGNFLKFAGAALALLGAGVMAFRRL